MAIINKKQKLTSMANSCYYYIIIIIIIILSAMSSVSFIYRSQCSNPYYYLHSFTKPQEPNQPINLLSFPSAWNQISFPIPSNPPKHRLKIALFVKKWPHRSRAGGLERHALTLYLAFAKWGHELHVFTTSVANLTVPRYPFGNLHFHPSKPNVGGYLDQVLAWKQFQEQNSSGRPFDVVHSESVGLLHNWARNVANLAVSWHGIAYETIHTDIIQELVRDPQEPQSSSLTNQMMRVVQEIKFFPSYSHHIATSEHVGDILKTIYMIPEERVHVILNGVDEDIFKPNSDANGNNFKLEFGINLDSKSLVLGMAGRLVKDKGHPLMFEALKQLFMENSRFQESVIVLIAGDGPWGSRYKELGANVIVLGPLERDQLARFYNAIDIFVHPTLRAQGFDQILLEAMLCGKPLMATKLSSITGSVIVGPEVGYTFSPTVDSLKKALHRVWRDGKENLMKKGKVCRERGLKLFTATKMAAAYERLFLCISCKNGRNCEEDYCSYSTKLVID